MKIIVLLAKDNSGKSTTIKKVVCELLMKGAGISSSNHHSHFKGMRPSDSLSTVFAEADASIQLIHQEKKIGITTFGDDISVLKNKIDFFEKNGCDCCICASHLAGNTHSYIERLANNPNHTVSRVYQIRIDDEKKDDPKYKTLCDISDALSVKEIISYI